MEDKKRPATRQELRERIVATAMMAFTAHGIRSIRMDDIATQMGISKRTLYEIFADKETLLKECIQKSEEENLRFVQHVQQQTDNVLEVILKIYMRSIEIYHNTNKKFFEDIKKYPSAYEQLHHHQHRDSEEALAFFRKGVEQGIFRDDINFAIVNLLLHEQIGLLLNTNICQKYSFLEVYESIIFTYLRGISTELGGRELDKFIQDYRRISAQQPYQQPQPSTPTTT